MQLRRPGELAGATQEISDNDGLWTALYTAAQCFRYAVGGSSDAKEQAQRSVRALMRLESITGVPGFPARAISSTTEPGYENRSKGEWHESTVEPGWMWKGDTSSDELVGHFFAYYVYHELVANQQEKEQVRATCKRIMDHLLDNNFQLVDKDGKVTTWGVWTPEKLNDDPKWAVEKGLNSLEMLSFLKVAQHIVGDPRYEAAYRDLVNTHHYALNAMQAKVTDPKELNHSDDELEFLSWDPLLQLEKDPGLRGIYTAGIRRTWQVVRPEASPLWNFIYGASTGEACEAQEAVQSLRDMPLDLIKWPVRNSTRADLKYDRQPDRFRERQLLRPLPWTERPMHKWNGNPFLPDGGDGMQEEDQTVWLLPYWLGRYHRIID
ncbi:MAG TPA: transcriptional regulator, partial [Armatimonadota bacterium]|nr:transcriptional regulator [Armatimonadota bacterium]